MMQNILIQKLISTMKKIQCTSNTNQILLLELDENKLKISDICEYVLERFDLVKSKPSMNKLVRFHTTNKYLLMAFNQIELNKLGNIIANREKLSVNTVIENYEVHLKTTLNKSPTRSRHAHVLRRMYGHFYKKLPKYKQQMIEQQISDYQNGKICLSETLQNLTMLTLDIDNMYLAKQSYFLLFSDKKEVWKML